jgi:hypothetical protein
MIGIPDGSIVAAQSEKTFLISRGHSELRKFSFLRHHLDSNAGFASNLGTFSRTQLDR